MAWTNKQKQLAVRACHAARISEEQRVDVILRNFRRAEHGGDITSTSPKLTCSDFEAFMAIVESYAGGKLLHFTEGYWEAAAADHLRRMRARVMRMAGELEAAGHLKASGAGLAGWIRTRVTKGATDRIEELDYHGLLALSLGIEAYAHSKGLHDAGAYRPGMAGQDAAEPIESARVGASGMTAAPGLFA